MKAPVAEEPLGLAQAPGDREDQTPGQIGGGLGEDIGGVGDPDAPAAGGLEIDVVEAHRAVAHDPETGAGGQDAVGHRVREQGEHRRRPIR